MVPAQFCRLPAATGNGVKENEDEVRRLEPREDRNGDGGDNQAE